MLSRFHLIPERHRQMDGIAISISYVSVLMHDEKIPGNKSPDIAFLCTSM